MDSTAVQITSVQLYDGIENAKAGVSASDIRLDPAFARVLPKRDSLLLRRISSSRRWFDPESPEREQGDILAEEFSRHYHIVVSDSVEARALAEQLRRMPGIEAVAEVKKLRVKYH